MAEVKRFVVLGDAGAGKSAFINAMYNYCYGTRNADEVFTSEKQSAVKLAIPCKGWTDLVSSTNPSSERDINDQTKSQTMTSNTYSLELNKDLTLELIDTPGFNDTEGISNDESNLEQIEKVLCSASSLNGIIIVANGSMVRLGTSFRHFLSLLHEIWPNSLMHNICVVLTNCNELSCNLDSAILRELFKVTDKTIFRIQNNIFRWDRTMFSKKTLGQFRQNFEDGIDTIDKLISLLAKFDGVSTDDFKMANSQQSLIDKSIQGLIESMISLLDTHQYQVNAINGIEGAKTMMQANKTWEKQHEITAIRWMEIPPQDLTPQINSDNSEVQNKTSTDKGATGSFLRSMVSLPTKLINKLGNSHGKCSSLDTKHKETTDQQPSSQKHDKISKTDNYTDQGTSKAVLNQKSEPTFKAEEIKLQLTLPDNAAISHYEDAAKQVCTLGIEVENLSKKQEKLRYELDSFLKQLTIHVQKMREINQHVDLVQKHNDLLIKFSEKIKVTDIGLDMVAYFNKTIKILGKPSTYTSESFFDCQTAGTEQMETDV